MAVGSPAEPSTRLRGAPGLRALLYVSLELYALRLSRTRSSTLEAYPLAQPHATGRRLRARAPVAGRRLT
jgi:hypothetical protein